MACAVCGADNGRGRCWCGVCGYMAESAGDARWSRVPEAAGFAALSGALGEEEPLVAWTRGRISGRWPRRIAGNVASFVAQFVNVGLTSTSLVIQPLHGSGDAITDAMVKIPLKDVSGMAATDADFLVAGRTIRLKVRLDQGEPFRVRASGRFAAEATNLLDVWRCIGTPLDPASPGRGSNCPSCERALKGTYRFCPYCGAKQGGI